MANVHPGATLTPHFRDFLPPWVARQPWYQGSGMPSLAMVGAFRLEDPDGEVGLETHLVSDGSAVYQIPMTYRGAPLDRGVTGAAPTLITTAEHSVLGARYIYDAVTDPVWVGEILRLVRGNGVSDPSAKRGAGPVEARGRLLAAWHPLADAVRVEVCRVLDAGAPAGGDGRVGTDVSAAGGSGGGVGLDGVFDDGAHGIDLLGVVIGSWRPGGPDAVPVSGRLASVHRFHR